MAPVLFTRDTTWAFCMGVTLQHTTPVQARHSPRKGWALCLSRAVASAAPSMTSPTLGLHHAAPLLTTAAILAASCSRTSPTEHRKLHESPVSCLRLKCRLCQAIPLPHHLCTASEGSKQDIAGLTPDTYQMAALAVVLLLLYHLWFTGTQIYSNYSK